MILLLTALAFAVPVQVNQQGRLLEADGAPVEGIHSVAVRLFDDPEYGYVLWEEAQSLSFINGYYSLFLGTDLSNPIDDSLLELDGLYVEVRVDGGPPLLPRKQLSSTPYSRMAGIATHVKGGTVDAQQIQIQGQVVIDSNGQWVGTTPTVNWNDLSGVPSEFLDGDDNTQLTESQVEDFVQNDPVNLASGSQVNGASILTQPSTCNNGEVLIYQGTGWVCGTDTDTTLTAQEVQQMIELMSLNLASLQVNGADVLTTNSSISWSQITDVPTEILESSDTLSELQCDDGEIITSNGGNWECSPFDTVIDYDGDGVLTWNDCDDENPSLLAQNEDDDCDGVVSNEDCDDSDVNNTDSNVNDADCDGVATNDDCDDSDPVVSSSFSGASQNCAPTTCKEILDNGFTLGDGNYWLDPTGTSPVEVFCDMTTDGGGWTQIAYAADLPYEGQFDSDDTRRYLDSNFSLVLSNAQITAIQQNSTEGKQTYVGLCNGAMHYYYNDSANYDYAFGFRFLDGSETPNGTSNYSPYNITVTADGCAANGGEGGSLSNATIFEINSIKVPVINVSSFDNAPGEPFGSPLTDNPAWLR